MGKAVRSLVIISAAELRHILELVFHQRDHLAVWRADLDLNKDALAQPTSSQSTGRAVKKEQNGDQARLTLNTVF